MDFIRVLQWWCWMSHADDFIKQLCLLEDTESGEQWERMPADFWTVISTSIRLNRECGQQELLAIVQELLVIVLVIELKHWIMNTSEDDAIIHTDRSIVWNVRSSWALAAQVGGRTLREGSGAFALRTSSPIIEVMAVTRAMAWLELLAFNHIYFLNSMNMLRKREREWVRRQRLESARQLRLTKIAFCATVHHQCKWTSWQVCWHGCGWNSNRLWFRQTF